MRHFHLFSPQGELHTAYLTHLAYDFTLQLMLLRLTWGKLMSSITAFFGVSCPSSICATAVSTGICTLYLRARAMTAPAVATPSATWVKAGRMRTKKEGDNRTGTRLATELTRSPYSRTQAHPTIHSMHQYIWPPVTVNHYTGSSTSGYPTAARLVISCLLINNFTWRPFHLPRS